MVSFYPGPSRIDPLIKDYLEEALQSGILSQNHRSNAFMALYESTYHAAQEYLGVPEDYSMYFISSATECWEILSQDLGAANNLHLYNGAFGEKGFLVNRSLYPNTTTAVVFDKEELPTIESYDANVLHLTQNETANGTQLPASWITSLRKKNPAALITVDATSSLGGQLLNIQDADVWFASVQKCFGLPSGMAVLFCSPQLVERCRHNKKVYYNSITQQELQFKKRQTTHTPNTLGIYLLNKVLRSRRTLTTLSQTLNAQAKEWYAALEQHPLFQPLVHNIEVRSDTVIAAQGHAADIERFKKHCVQNHYIIGNGYGQHASETFRIANFPSHQKEEIAFLHQLLISFQ